MVFMSIIGLLLIGFIIFIGIKKDNFPLFVPPDERLDPKAVQQLVEATKEHK